jgi:hypothetical protein
MGRAMGMPAELGAISHTEVDWDGLMLCPAPEAADALREILSAAEATLEQAETRLTVIRDNIFNLRMVCFRIVSDRELWKLDTDPEYGVPYKTMARWMAVLYPKDEGLRYAQEANATQKALPAANLHDLAEMKRTNAVQLARTSEHCRREPEVIEAAKTATEKQFRAELNKRGQHLEAPETLKFTYPSGDADQVRKYLQWIAGKAELEPEDYQGALLYLAIHELEEIAQ